MLSCIAAVAIYHWCYDGGKRDECTSSHVDSYI